VAASNELIDRAHRAAIERDPAELARELQALLGAKAVAHALGDLHPKSVGRYARGTREPGPRVRGRLVDLYIVVEIVRHGMADATSARWMLTTNPQLGTSPLDAIHAGRAFEVMSAAEAFVVRGQEGRGS